MNYKMMGRIFAEILALEAFFMLPPLFISIYDGVDGAAKAFLYTIGILIAVAYLPQSKARFLRSGGHSLRWPRLDFFKSFRCIALFYIGRNTVLHRRVF